MSNIKSKMITCTILIALSFSVIVSTTGQSKWNKSCFELVTNHTDAITAHTEAIKLLTEQNQILIDRMDRLKENIRNLEGKTK